MTNLSLFISFYTSCYVEILSKTKESIVWLFYTILFSYFFITLSLKVNLQVLSYFPLVFAGSKSSPLFQEFVILGR